jgi:hypothetical protein
MDHLVKEAIEIRLHSNNFNRDEGFSLSESVSQSESESRYDWRSVSQSVSQSWYRAPSGAHDHIFQSYIYDHFGFCPIGGALSDERVDLSFFEVFVV